AQCLLGAIAAECVIALQTEHEADEQARHGNDDQRVVANEVNLLRYQPGPFPHNAGTPQQIEEKPGECAQANHRGSYLATKGSKKPCDFSHKRFWWSASQCSKAGEDG